MDWFVSAKTSDGGSGNVQHDSFVRKGRQNTSMDDHNLASCLSFQIYSNLIPNI